MTWCENRIHRSRGITCIRSTSIFFTSVARVSPRRMASRCTCVSTTTPSARPNSVPSTTLAVLRATPGSRVSAASVRGSSPPCSSTSAVAVAFRFLAFCRKKPVDRTISSSSGSSARDMAMASGKRAKSAGVTRLTRSSVHCADRMVAHSSWNGDPRSTSQSTSG